MGDATEDTNQKSSEKSNDSSFPAVFVLSLV